MSLTEFLNFKLFGKTMFEESVGPSTQECLTGVCGRLRVRRATKRSIRCTKQAKEFTEPLGLRWRVMSILFSFFLMGMWYVSNYDPEHGGFPNFLVISL